MAVAASALLSSCGGGNDRVRATITEDDCEYSGSTSNEAGTLSIELVNETEHKGIVGLAPLGKGYVLEELEPLLRETLERDRLGQDRPALPSWFSGLLNSNTVDGGTTTSVSVDVSTGPYAVVCYILDQGRQRVDVAAKLEVAG